MNAPTRTPMLSFVCLVLPGLASAQSGDVEADAVVSASFFVDAPFHTTGWVVTTADHGDGDSDGEQYRLSCPLHVNGGAPTAGVAVEYTGSVFRNLPVPRAYREQYAAAPKITRRETTFRLVDGTLEVDVSALRGALVLLSEGHGRSLVRFWTLSEVWTCFVISDAESAEYLSNLEEGMRIEQARQDAADSE